MAMVLERDFKKQFYKELKKMGCTPLNYKQDSTTVQGFPDAIVLLPESLVVFLEFKNSKTAKFRPNQKEWQQKLKDRNFFTWVVYPANQDEVLKEIKDLL